MTEKKSPRGNKLAQTKTSTPRKKTFSETGFSQKAKPARKGYSSTTGSETTKKYKKNNPETGFSQKAKTNRKGYSSTEGTEIKPKFKKANSETGFSQKAKPFRKGYSSTIGDSKPKKKFSEKSSDEKPSFKKEGFDKEKKPFGKYKKNNADIGFSQKAKPAKKGYYTQEDKPQQKRKRETDETISGERPFQKRKFNNSFDEKESSRFIKKTRKREDNGIEPKKFTGRGKKTFEKSIPVPEYNLDKYEKRKKTRKDEDHDENGLVRLNRYIANSGICSRRDADLLIQAGEIKVNGNVVTELGYKVKPSDTVKYGNRTLNREKMVYVLLNKPKDFITTMDDPEERKTVMDLVGDACPQRIYPVGRLDRNTSGLLLLTNDGELAEKLTHPSHEIKKLYEAELDKPITKEHFDAIIAGVELEDGFIKVDEMATVSPDRTTLGVQIHSGKNRVVRRIFEYFGYEVTRLDRVMYAGLTKKDLPRGKWRFLTEREVITLKFLI
jgi:23S rRNA pseudouridine2605 synthase